MPYISKQERALYDEEIDSLVTKLLPSGNVEPHVTYIVYKLMKELFGRAGFRWKIKVTPLKILESVKFEYYRRVIGPYEDNKIEENGEI